MKYPTKETKRVKIAIPLEIEVDAEVDDFTAAQRVGEQLTADGYLVCKSGYYDATPPVVVVDREWWYVRSAAHRGMDMMLEAYAGLKAVHADLEQSNLAHNTAKGLSSEIVQWLHETAQYFEEMNERIVRSSDRFHTPTLDKAKAVTYLRD